MTSREKSRKARGWRRHAVAVSLAALGGLALHCGDGALSLFESAPCTTIYSGQCGADCSADPDCPAGLYCSSQGCVAECAFGKVACPNGGACSDRGRCGGDGTFTGGGDGGPNNCADINAQLNKVLPTVILLIDQSGSMNADFGNQGSRWNVLRNALMDPQNGIVKKLENDVAFGLALYTWESNNGGACPALTNVNYAVGNYNAINDVYSKADYKDDTPTGDSIYALTGIDRNTGNVSPGGFAAAQTPGPKYIVLATDGDPDSCADPDSNGTDPPKNLTIQATQAAFNKGIRTFVIAIGDEVTEAHQADVANAGMGLPPTQRPAAKYYRTNNQGELVTAFNEIIYGTANCVFDLNGRVSDGAEQRGNVTLDGQNVAFDPQNGWRLNSPTQIELVGAACDKLKAGAALAVSFPCGAFTLK